MMTKTQKVAVIWADWNDEKLTANQALYEISKLFPRATMKEWRKRIDQRETAKLSVMEAKT